MSKIHITEIAGKKFVLGLFWQSITPGKDNRKESKRMGLELNKDLYVIRDGDNLQAGFGSMDEGYTLEQFSLAAAITKGAEQISINGSWLGVFKLPDNTYAFIALNEGKFLPEGDFGGTYEEVKDKLMKALSYGLVYTNIIVPEDLKSYIGSGEYRPIDDFLPKKNGKLQIHKWWNLKAVNPSFPVTKLFLVLAAAGILGAGYYYYNVHIEKQKILEQQRVFALARQAASRSTATITPKQEYVIHPWISQVKSSDFINQCLHSIDGKYINPGQWQLVTATCKQNSLDLAWDRKLSNINRLLQVFPKAIIDVSGDKATFSIPYQIEGEKSDEKTLDPLVSRANFLSFFQARHMSVRFNEDIPPPPPPVKASLPGQAEAAPPPIRDFRTYSFEVQSLISPSGLSEVFAYPVTRINLIEFNLSSDKSSSVKWRILGNVYSTQ